MLTPIMRRGVFEWNRHLISEEEFASRVELIRQHLAADNIDALLVYGHLPNPGNLAYISHFPCTKRGALLYLPREGEASLAVELPGRDLTPNVLSWTWVSDVRSAFGAMAESLLADRLKDRLVEHKQPRLGVEGIDRFPTELFDELMVTAPDDTHLVGTEIISRMRRIKRPPEEACIRIAARHCTLALGMFRSTAIAGKSELEVAADVERFVRRQGVEDVNVLTASGATPQLPRVPVARRIQEKDYVSLEVSVEAERYWSTAGSTISLDRHVREVALPQMIGLRNGRLALPDGWRVMMMGVGLEPQEPPGENDRVERGNVVVIRRCDDSFAAATYLVADEAIRID